MRHHLKNLMLPISMLGGALFYRWMGYLTPMSPYLILMMLTITYCKLDFRSLRIGRFQWLMLALQMGIAAVAYGAIRFINPTLAAGIFICVYIPTATAAPVITGMLGGSIPKVATYSLLCNLFVAITGPAVLAAVGEHPEMTFIESFLIICRRVFPLLIIPIVLALALEKFVPKWHDSIARHQSLSFYIWAISLFIVVGSSVSFVISNFSADKASLMAWLALGALAVCLIQFKTGRQLGARFNDKVSGGQSLGQKNTVLAVWLALTYLDPVASVAPAAYVAWQNIINSWQLMKHERSMHTAHSSTPDTRN